MSSCLHCGCEKSLHNILLYNLPLNILFTICSFLSPLELIYLKYSSRCCLCLRERIRTIQTFLFPDTDKKTMSKRRGLFLTKERKETTPVYTWSSRPLEELAPRHIYIDTPIYKYEEGSWLRGLKKSCWITSISASQMEEDLLLDFLQPITFFSARKVELSVNHFSMLEKYALNFLQSLTLAWVSLSRETLSVIRNFHYSLTDLFFYNIELLFVEKEIFVDAFREFNSLKSFDISVNRRSSLIQCDQELINLLFPVIVSLPKIETFLFSNDSPIEFSFCSSWTRLTEEFTNLNGFRYVLSNLQNFICNVFPEGNSEAGCCCVKIHRRIDSCDYVRYYNANPICIPNLINKYLSQWLECQPVDDLDLSSCYVLIYWYLSSCETCDIVKICGHESLVSFYNQLWMMNVKNFSSLMKYAYKREQTIIVPQTVKMFPIPGFTDYCSN